MDNILYIVMPCYNEEQALPETSKAALAKLSQLKRSGKISDKSKILLVDDGSKDDTWNIIKSLAESDASFAGIKLSRNRGHQNALLAGLMTAKEYADMVISMDADLQDDINAVDEMIDKCVNDGCEIVYGVRSSRKKDTFFKRTTARAYYKFLNIMGVNIIYDHADYRLMTKRALDALEDFPEVNLFLRGMVPMIGFKSDSVKYSRGARTAGESKYPLKKMLSFAFEGITSLSIKPIKFITFSGGLIFICALIMLVYTLIRFFTGATVSGWPSLIISIWALGGLQLVSIGIIGEYIGKVYLETKRRPKFIIEQSTLND